MLKRLAFLVSLGFCTPAIAIVGGGRLETDAMGRTVVTIVGSAGTFCSGVLIAQSVILTAAHCVMPGAIYKFVAYNDNAPPELLNVKSVAIHPQFKLGSILAHRATADVALLRLERPAPASRSTALIGTPRTPIVSGAAFTVAGVGVARRGDYRSGGVVRKAALIATGQPGNLQIRLVDPTTANKKDGLGACTGDSGAPVFETQNEKAVVVGVVSWSTGPNNAAGCGGLTGVTPLSLYQGWIGQRLREWHEPH